jgi:hypothetical protein
MLLRKTLYKVKETEQCYFPPRRPKIYYLALSMDALFQSPK